MHLSTWAPGWRPWYKGTMIGRRCTALLMLMALQIAVWPSQVVATPAEEQELEKELFGEDEQEEVQPPAEQLVIMNRPREVTETSVDRPGRKQIELRGTQDAAALLESLSSAHITLNSLGERLITLRGMTGAQVAIMEDGLPGGDPFRGVQDLTRLPTRSIRQITLIKGTAPVLLAGGALAGAVNIIGRTPGDGPLVGGTLEHGAYNSWRANLEHSQELTRLAYTVYAGLFHQDHSGLSRDFLGTPNERPALRDHSDRTDWHAGGSLRYVLTRGHGLKLRVNYTDGVAGVPPSTLAPQPLHLYIGAARRAGVSLAHEGKFGRVELDEAVYVRINQHLLKMFDDGDLASQDLPGSGDVWSQDIGAGGRMRGSTWVDGLPWGLTFIRVAAGVYHNRHEQGGAVNGQTEPAPVERTILSLGPEAEAMLNPCWSLTVGIQLDLELPEEADNALSWGPLVSALYAPLDSVAVRGTVARRTRFPTLQERYSSQGKRQPNPELEPESAWHMGLEATWQLLPGIALSGGVNDAEVLDVITPESASAGVERLVNGTSARLVTVELGFTLSPFDQLRLAAVYSFLYARSTEDGAQDIQLPYRPMNKASLELVFAPWNFVELATFLLVHGERVYPAPGTNSFGLLSPYAIWNARIAVRPVSWGTVFVRASNILGTHHVTEYGFPDPGRRIWLGLDLNYDRS